MPRMSSEASAHRMAEKDRPKNATSEWPASMREFAKPEPRAADAGAATRERGEDETTLCKAGLLRRYAAIRMILLGAATRPSSG